jgi:hypothetical protein
MPVFTTKQIKEIAEQLDCGFRAFYHKNTGELIFVPNTDQHDMDTSAWNEELKTLETHFINYCEIDAMESGDSFQVMVDFTEQLKEPKLKERLKNALNRKKPFREFKIVIDNSGKHRQEWFDFKNKRYFEWTEQQLKPFEQSS